MLRLSRGPQDRLAHEAQWKRSLKRQRGSAQEEWWEGETSAWNTGSGALKEGAGKLDQGIGSSRSNVIGAHDVGVFSQGGTSSTVDAHVALLLSTMYSCSMYDLEVYRIIHSSRRQTHMHSIFFCLVYTIPHTELPMLYTISTYSVLMLVLYAFSACLV